MSSSEPVVFDWATRDPMDLLVWVDVETTGLDENEHVMLQIATIATDARLMVIDYGPDLVIAQPAPLPLMPSVVIEMHEKSGLLQSIKAGEGVSLPEAEASIMAWIAEFGVEPGIVPMCGSSVQFDRKYLARYMPGLHDWFFRRNIDVSSWKEGIKRFAPRSFALMGNQITPRRTHKPVDDLLDSIEEFRFYRKLLVGWEAE